MFALTEDSIRAGKQISSEIDVYGWHSSQRFTYLNAMMVRGS